MHLELIICLIRLPLGALIIWSQILDAELSTVNVPDATELQAVDGEQCSVCE